jgi:hypothetical protein
VPVPGLGVEEGGGFQHRQEGGPPTSVGVPPGGAGGSGGALTGLLTRRGPAGGRRAVREAGRLQAGRRQATTGGREAAVGAARGAQSGTQPSSQSPDRQGNAAQRVLFFRALRAHDSVWRWSSGARGVGPQGSAPRRPSPAGYPVGPAALRAQRGDSGSAALAQQGGPSRAAAAPRPCDAGAPAAAAAADPRRPRSHGSAPRGGGGGRGGSGVGGVEPPLPERAPVGWPPEPSRAPAGHAVRLRGTPPRAPPGATPALAVRAVGGGVLRRPGSSSVPGRRQAPNGQSTPPQPSGARRCRAGG